MNHQDRGRALRLADLVDNPEFLLYQINLARRDVAFLEVTKRTFDESTFLDDRIAHSLGRLHHVGMDDLMGLMGRIPDKPGPIHFLAHTSFCCSTLLARSLRFERRTLVLREPLILRLLGDARRHGPRAGTPAEQRRYLDLALRLLNKPYHADQQVIAKPANLANTLLCDWLELQREARGVILTSSLEDYLVSNLKKPVSTREKMPWVAEALARDTDYLGQVPTARDALENPIRAAAVAWHAQRHALGLLLERYPARLLALDQEDLLEHPEAALETIAGHLRLPVTSADIVGQVNGPLWRRHAKDPRQRFDHRMRERDRDRIRELHRDTLHQTLDWAASELLAHLPVPPRLPGAWQFPTFRQGHRRGA